MPENQKKRFGRKTIISVIFIVLFVTSLAVVFFYQSPEKKVGYVTVQRTEGYWRNTFGNATEGRYLINYGTYGVSDSPSVTIHDKADPGMTQIDIAQESTKVEKITYNKDTGDITIVVKDVKAQEKVLAQLAFVMDPVDIFAAGAYPTTTVTPETIYWGDKASVSVEISPFTVAQTTNITYVGVFAWPTDAVTAISDVGISPAEGECEPPMYQAIWEYNKPASPGFGAHVANYTLTLPSTPGSGEVLLRTWVEVRYSSPLRISSVGTIDGADGAFFTWDSSISYQYEKGIQSRLG